MYNCLCNGFASIKCMRAGKGFIHRSEFRCLICISSFNRARMLHDPVFSLEIILDVDIYGQTGFFMDNCGQTVDRCGYSGFDWSTRGFFGHRWPKIGQDWSTIRESAPFLSRHARHPSPHGGYAAKRRTAQAEVAEGRNGAYKRQISPPPQPAHIKKSGRGLYAVSPILALGLI